MARSLNASARDTVAYRGEIWTGPLEPPLEYELRDLEAPSSVHVTAELERGRFTIQTHQPTLKVAWRISGRRTASHQPHPQQEEGMR